MRKLLNTLFITNPDSYLSLDGQNVVISRDGEKIGRLPLHNLEAIMTFGYTGASPGLMGYCADNSISLVFLTASGRFRARVIGKSKGNVVLRKEQYRISDDESRSVKIAQNFLISKLYNNKWIVERTIRDYPLRVDVEKFKIISNYLSESIKEIAHANNLESLRGVEGQAAVTYNSAIDDMILQQKEYFFFHFRSRRPPLDRTNAMLSFAYTLLANDCGAALEAVGLDSYVGFLHRDRPGRISLALDIMEELRGVYADRFVLGLINKRIIKANDFVINENDSVTMTDEGKKIFLNAWQQRKQDKITHPFLKEKISWGLVPFSQALLLARFIRGDLDEYPSFLWK